jgi:GrpB-like predicted nucleotidyltransferase (UPF0157 family)
MIRAYDPTWPARFLELAERVKAHLASSSDLPEAIRRLGTLGYAHEGDLGIAGRDAFRWPSGEKRHHLYVLAAGARELRRHLAFRDALRADRTLRDAYSELKRNLALRYPDDRKAYTEGKSAFITKIAGAE